MPSPVDIDVTRNSFELAVPAGTDSDVRQFVFNSELPPPVPHEAEPDLIIPTLAVVGCTAARAGILDFCEGDIAEAQQLWEYGRLEGERRVQASPRELGHLHQAIRNSNDPRLDNDEAVGRLDMAMAVGRGLGVVSLALRELSQNESMRYSANSGVAVSERTAALHRYNSISWLEHPLLIGFSMASVRATRAYFGSGDTEGSIAVEARGMGKVGEPEVMGEIHEGPLIVRSLETRHGADSAYSLRVSNWKGVATLLFPIAMNRFAAQIEERS